MYHGFIHPTDQTRHQLHVLDTELDLHHITSGFLGALAKDVACQQENASYLDTWLCFLYGLAYDPIVETSFPELVVFFFSRLSTLNMSLYFLDIVLVPTGETRRDYRFALCLYLHQFVCLSH